MGTFWDGPRPEFFSDVQPYPLGEGTYPEPVRYRLIAEGIGECLRKLPRRDVLVEKYLQNAWRICAHKWWEERKEPPPPCPDLF